MFKRSYVAIAVLLLCVAGVARSQSATFLGSFDWSHDDPRFGGFSGIHISENGHSFITITDRGLIITGRLVRNAKGITKLEILTKNNLKDAAGKPLTTLESDAEGLAVHPDGKILISFEHEHNVRSYDRADSNGSMLPQHSDFTNLQRNSSLEALAIDSNGALYTIPERSGRMTRPFPVYKLENGAWKIHTSIPRRGEFLVVGADIGPDNRLYVLERHFSGIGFFSRLRRFELDGSNETEIFETSMRTHDNLEGIGVWKNANNELIATMISDDNFRFFQKTEIVEYLLPN